MERIQGLREWVIENLEAAHDITICIDVTGSSRLAS